MRRLICAAVLLCAGCGSSDRAEVARVPSPDGAYLAILTETSAGATTSFGYEVRVGLADGGHFRQVAYLYGATRNAAAYGVDLRWSGSHRLLVRYLRARTVKSYVPTFSVGGKMVRVVLQSGVNNPSAPAGGMEYNLKKPLSRAG